jgi:hypothetical protein
VSCPLDIAETRHLYVKCPIFVSDLITIGICVQNLVELPNIKFNEDLFGSSRVISSVHRNRRTDGRVELIYLELNRVANTLETADIHAHAPGCIRTRAVIVVSICYI